LPSLVRKVRDKKKKDIVHSQEKKNDTSKAFLSSLVLVQLVLDLLLQAGLLLVSMRVVLVNSVGVTSKGAISVVPVDSLGLKEA
jgi:hypothetical protein